MQHGERRKETAAIMIKQVFKWIKNEPKHADTESSKEKCPKLPKKSRSDSTSSISSFTFVSQARRFLLLSRSGVVFVQGIQ